MINLPHIATDVTQACQLSCVACNHAVPLWRKHGVKTATVEDVERDLTHLATFVHVKSWAAMGGEPLLHHNLVNVLIAARRTGLMDRVQVWTNGLLVQRQPDLFWRSLDELVVSIYPGKLDDALLAWIEKKCQDEGVCYLPRDERPNAQPNFMTFLEPTPTDAVTTQNKYTSCAFRGGHNCCASHGFFFMCCCGPHIPLLVQGRSYGDDGVRIDGLTEAGLLTYMHQREPFGACTHCAGRHTAKRIPWSEQRDPVIWLNASAGR